MKRTMLRDSKINVRVRDINASAWGFVPWALILYKDSQTNLIPIWNKKKLCMHFISLEDLFKFNALDEKNYYTLIFFMSEIIICRM